MQSTITALKPCHLEVTTHFVKLPMHNFTSSAYSSTWTEHRNIWATNFLAFNQCGEDQDINKILYFEQITHRQLLVFVKYTELVLLRFIGLFNYGLFKELRSFSKSVRDVTKFKELRCSILSIVF